MTTAAQALFAASILSGLASYRKSKPTESFLQPFCALRVRTTERWKLFCKDLLCTRALFAEEATNLNNEMDETATHWKIVQGSPIATLHTFGDRPTTRTCSRWRRCTQGNGDLIGNSDLRNLQVFINEFWKDDHSFLLAWGNVEKLFNLIVYHILHQRGCVRLCESFPRNRCSHLGMRRKENPFTT